MVGLSGQVKTILLELGLSLKLETVLLNVNETSAEVKLTVSTFAPGHSQSRTGWRWTRWRRRRWPSLPSSWSASAPASACSGTMGKSPQGTYFIIIQTTTEVTRRTNHIIVYFFMLEKNYYYFSPSGNKSCITFSNYIL